MAWLRPPLLVLLLVCLAAPAARAAAPGAAACAASATSLAFVESLAEMGRAGGFHALERIAGWYAQLLGNRYVLDCVALNHVQALGTHNSYHQEPRPRLFQTLLLLSDEFLEWQYAHRPLAEQLESQGIRKLELDVYHDPDGGRYAERPVLRLLGDPTTAPDPVMQEPAMKVLHVNDLDFETTCPTLVACLREVKAWSDDHPRHLPIAILLELKDDPIPDPLALGFTVPLPFDARAFDDLDAEIRSVFPPSRLVTPDDVRGDAATLEEAVLTRGWPTLREARGRVLFLMDNADLREAYRDGRPSLEGRVIFTNSVPGEPDAAFVKVNDPQGDPTLIPDLVRAGYVVRTRADGGPADARANDTAQRDAALASGAQWVSTDYPVPDPRFGTGFSVAIPGGMPARCNPVNAPPGCREARLEE